MKVRVRGESSDGVDAAAIEPDAAAYPELVIHDDTLEKEEVSERTLEFVL
jgi:hypothetical protein